MPASVDDLQRRLWAAADALRGPVDPADFKAYVLPMLFWKWISDTWDWELARSPSVRHAFALPDGTHWATSTQPGSGLGGRIADALERVEGANPHSLTGIFGDASWGNEARLPASALADLVAALDGLALNPDECGHDVPGQAYEYMLRAFADESGRKAGEFFTPRAVVRLLMGILRPTEGESVYDPACGSGGMLLEAVNSVRDSGGDPRALRLYGQEVNLTTTAIARMNLRLHGIDDVTIVRGDTLRRPGLRGADGRLSAFDVVAANPPFSLTRWGAEAWAADARSIGGVPPAGNGDFAWIQHMVASMNPTSGRVGVVVPHGVLFRAGAEASIREDLVRRDLVEAVIGLPRNLFHATSISTCLLILRADKQERRRGSILFIDGSTRYAKARNRNTLGDDDITALVAAYAHGDRGIAVPDVDVPLRLVPVAEVEANGFDLSIGRYAVRAAAETLSLPDALRAYRSARASRVEAEQSLFASLAAEGIADPSSDHG